MTTRATVGRRRHCGRGLKSQQTGCRTPLARAVSHYAPRSEGLQSKVGAGWLEGHCLPARAFCVPKPAIHKPQSFKKRNSSLPAMHFCAGSILLEIRRVAHTSRRFSSGCMRSRLGWAGGADTRLLVSAICAEGARLMQFMALDPWPAVKHPANNRTSNSTTASHTAPSPALASRMDRPAFYAQVRAHADK
jgi:hypothetical protein